MPKIGGVKGKIPDTQSLTDALEEVICEAMSVWQRRYIVPGTKFQAPIYSGPDPREEFHPRGLLRRYIGLVQAQTRRGKTYLTCGIPGATERGDKTDPDRAWIITQVLHRGWAAPKARLKPMRFAVWTRDLRNPDVKTSPPEGIPENPEVTWIFVTYARPQSKITLNPFHTRVFESQAGAFIRVLIPRLERVLRRKVRMKKVRLGK